MTDAQRRTKRPTGPGSARHRQVAATAVMEAEGCLDDLKRGRRAALEIKKVTERMLSPEYKGRVLVELLQNAHDAHPDRDGVGRVEIVLDEDEGEHGVLYVANGGRPLGPKNFEALCSIGLSSKRPDEGIGHKGVGFKSVLQLTAAPELYSVARATSKTFDGFCFRFARDGDFDRLARQVAPDRPEAAGQLRANLSSLKVPVPVDDIPAAVVPFRRRGLVTVVRLPLRNADARQEAARQLRELTDDGVPFELFLDRLGKVSVTHRVGSRGRSNVYTRKVEPLLTSRGLKIQQVTLRRRIRLIMVTAAVDRDRAHEAIAADVESGPLTDDWRALGDSAVVSVAVPAGEPLKRGRLYTFLPMGAQPNCPVRGFLNAPFHTDVSRRTMAEATHWNDLLLDTAAEACARAAVLVDERRVAMPAGALVDLMCWDHDQMRRLELAFTAQDREFDDVPFMPVLHPPGARTSFRQGYLWHGPDRARVFTPQAVAAAGFQHVLDPRLHPLRADRLVALGAARRLGLVPDASVLAGWAESVASALAENEFDPGKWADYYHDLSTCFSRTGEELKDRKIVLTVDGKRAPAGDPGLFFRRSDGPSATLPALPPGLAKSISFVHTEIAWTGRKTSRRSRGRTWLEEQGLVRDYSPQALLDVLGEAMRKVQDDDEALREYLLFACALWEFSADRHGKRPVIKGLLVPGRKGWVPATGAMFGKGWTGGHGGIDRTLVRFFDRTEAVSPDLVSAADRVVRPAQDICAGTRTDAQTLRRFLEQQGVRHGLLPTYVATHQAVKGQYLNRPSLFPGLWALHLDPDERAQWQSTAQRWPKRRDDLYLTVEYRPTRRRVAMLPGQREYAAFDEESRRLYAELIVHGLDTWDREALEFRFTGGSDQKGTSWPTPLTAFLSRAPWIPQTGDDEDAPAFTTIGQTWWWASTEAPPAFLTVASAAVRSRQSERVLKRLELLGVRRWDGPGTAADRLRHLPALLHRMPRLRHGPLGHLLRRAYEQAWADLLPPDGFGSGWWSGNLPQLLVSRAGRLDVLTAECEPEPVYVVDIRGTQQRRLLDQAPLPVLSIDDRALGQRVHEHLEAQGRFVTRPTSEAELDVRVDQLPIAEAPGVPLFALAGAWLETLIVALVEFDEERSSRARVPAAGRVRQRLRSCDVVVARTAVTHIAGHALDASGDDRSLLHDDPDEPRLVVVCARQRSDWHVLETAATALSTLIGAPYLSTAVQLALIELNRLGRAVADVTEADIASVLAIPHQRLEAVLADRASIRSGSARLVPLLACVDLALAEELQRGQETLHDRGQLHDWLVARLDVDRADQLLGLVEGDDRQRTLTALGVPLAEANRAWQTLGLPTVNNAETHQRQFQAWLQQNRARLTDRVRDAYVATHKAGAPLMDYVRLRSLPGLDLDPRWGLEHWDLPVDLLNAHAEEWTVTHLPPPPALQHHPRPVAEIRETCVDTIHARLPRLRVRMEAWLNRQGREAPSLPSAAEVASAMDAEGLLDFEPISTRTLIAWLQTHGHWPAGMPATDRVADLGLYEPAPLPPSPPAGSTPVPVAPSGPSLLLNGRSLPIGPDHLRDLARQVAVDLSPDQLATSPQPGTPSASALPRQRTTSAAAGRGGGYRAVPRDPQRDRAVGLAGEVAVAAWLERQYGVPREEAWKSGLRQHVFADGSGDDSLGYDFLIHDGDRTLLYEVKASTGDRGEFELGESEVERASNLRPDETYTIVYVSHVLDNTHRRITPLPNPFSAPGLAGYRLVGTAMRLRFELPKG
ncbi:sacsin N-terminal ATP-binding-like domain-containing protein [Streptomyces sp. IBSBF 2394]|uniref:sacsin N-terminal ATP-binding-like domain-containing protein n=1 Tax=Streptomyces sp. IBSBF 2394 TaxID=2903532 RepID=UPI002FDC71CC